MVCFDFIYIYINCFGLFLDTLLLGDNLFFSNRFKAHSVSLEGVVDESFLPCMGVGATRVTRER